jgi:hypothetical protein
MDFAASMKGVAQSIAIHGCAQKRKPDFRKPEEVKSRSLPGQFGLWQPLPSNQRQHLTNFCAVFTPATERLCHGQKVQASHQWL